MFQNILRFLPAAKSISLLLYGVMPKVNEWVNGSHALVTEL